MYEFSTPMMKQYMEIKSSYADCLLFFRMGDFYELFMEDAHIGSQVLSITLTSKAGGKDGKIPMAGVPYHAADSYIAKLVKAGFKVAICEQLSPPSKKGLVKRGVVRIVTPGTMFDENSLDKKENNFIISLLIKGDSICYGIADVSTGYFAIAEENPTDSISGLKNLLARIMPSECIVPEALYEDPEILKQLSQQKGMNISSFPGFPKEIQESEKILKKHFVVSTLEGFGVGLFKSAYIPGAALLEYIKSTQNGTIPHIKKIEPLMDQDSVQLDRSTILNLELFATIREQDTRGSLLSVIDETITAMGGRLLKNWIRKPLSDKEAIEERLDAVSFLSNSLELRNNLRDELKGIPDIERLLARLSVQLGNVRDIVQLKQALASILSIKKLYTGESVKLLNAHAQAIPSSLEKVIDLITEQFVDEPPFSVKEGRFIKKGFNQVLDAKQGAIVTSKDFIKNLEKTERERTGISTLKVRFNKVFGYYIEVSKTNVTKVPNDYIRKQTLVNGERFITEELKKHEDIILNAEEEINAIEYKLYTEFLDKLQSFTFSIQQAATSIALIDVLAGFSCIADKNRYTRPKIVYSGEIRIQDGRHPVVEQLMEEVPFVPNNTTLDNVSQSLLLITGPNMAGKSVYIRQVALIVLMAHLGCFVPATSAHISVVDKIFVRSGASDFITSGLSTFMVEMVETAHILNNASEKSLIIMDEIGRGTTTYDGISLAWAVAEYLVTDYPKPPKILFATHYHELQLLEEEYPHSIKNFHMAVTEQSGNPIFLHTLLPGGASYSFGISVAKLAGIPNTVIARAHEMLAVLEKRGIISSTAKTPEVANPPQIHTLDLSERILKKELASLDIAGITPLQALNILAGLKEKLIIIEAEENVFSETS